ncbi:MAG TPA: 2-dehydropantoate 2-reductase N-terminal domain-containing protein, partial [Candidatus Limnocylindrales bacterium]|nr:2-dehydropantoate 2-reductase N-terminal domain-containing protein [Candidatus Limnocylindrales bacterium]
MRVVVVGRGAVGSFLGATLALGGEEVVLAGRGDWPIEPPARLAIVERDGTVRETTVRTIGAASLGTLGEPDLVILAVRQPSLPDGLRSIEGWPATATLTVQNGIGAEELVGAARPLAPLVAASLTASVALDGEGRVRRLRAGGIALAGVGGVARTLAAPLAGRFDRGGLRAVVVDDPAAMKWSKLIANLVGNATSAILDIDPGAVYADPRLFAIERRQLAEAVAVVDAMGLRLVALPGADVRLLALALRLPRSVGRPILQRVVARGRGGKSPSLRQHLADDDVAQPSEVAWLNGAVAA